MLYQNNPFNILGISLEDNRRAIAQKAEEQALFIDAQQCADARTILTNPQKRIAAEVHWFVDCSDSDIDAIKAYISDTLSGDEKDNIPLEKWSSLTQLNIQFACADATNYRTLSQAKFLISSISRLFEAIDVSSVMSLINDKRSIAGFPAITREQDVSEALSELRTEIKQYFSQKLQALDEEKYIKTITALSELYSGKGRYKGSAILEDLISDYQLFISDSLSSKASSIIKMAGFIGQGANKIKVSDAVDDLLSELSSWDRLAQPLQLGALTKGNSHSESAELLVALRKLALKLHNDYSLSSESLKITEAIQEVFKELPEYAELLSDDNQALTKLISEKKIEDTLGPILTSITDKAEKIKSLGDKCTRTDIIQFIDTIKSANKAIKESGDEEIEELRSGIGLLARSMAIDLHNDCEKTEDALFLVEALQPIFSDLPDVSKTLTEDKKTLQNLIEEKKESEKILASMTSLDAYVTTVKNSVSSNRYNMITELINRMVTVDNQIKAGVHDQETRNKARENTALLVRSAGIEMHNVKHDSNSALRIISAVKNQFYDLPTISSMTSNDIASLNTQIAQLNAMQRASQTQTKNSSKSGCLIPCIVLGVIILIAAVSGSNSGTSKSTSSSSYSSSYSSTTKPASTPRPTSTPKPTPTPQAMPSSGKVFYCSTTDKPSSFKVTNNGSSNYYMKFVKAGTDTTVITFFVRANSTVTIDMPAGNLELRYAYGSTWYGESKLFGENTLYAKDEEPYDFSRYTWEISLYTTYGYGDSMDVESISPNEF